MTKSITTSIAPWLTVRNAAVAAGFYKSAFEAIEKYRLEDPEGGLVLLLSIDGAEFWLSGESSTPAAGTPEMVGGNTMRLILTMTDPETAFKRALSAGAREIFPVGEGHGWRLGRLEDPFGLHWEIGHPLTDSP
jgi:PhnB protein